MGPVPAPLHIAAPVGPVLGGDVYCADCDYNLRGLPRGGACPECGAAIQKSLEAETLASAPPAWRRRLWWGVVVLAISPLPLIAGTFLRKLTTPWLMVTWASLPAGFKLDALQSMLPEYNHGAWALAAATTLLAAAGTWLLAAPAWPWAASDPRRHRRALRGMSAFAAAAAAIFLAVRLLAALPIGGRWLAWIPFATRMVLSSAFNLLDAAHAIVLVSYLGRLAARGGDAGLPVFLRRLTWVVTLQRGLAGAGMAYLCVGYLRWGVYWFGGSFVRYLLFATACATPLLAMAMFWALYRLLRQLRPRPRVTPATG